MANVWKVSFVLVLFVSAAFGKTDRPKRRVCVIGAGIAGLAAAKHLSLYPDEFEPIVFEKQSDVGGNWIYSDSTTVDKHGLPVHSSVYANLRLNFPKEIEITPDYPYFEGSDPRTFVGHTQMLDYFRNYTEHFNLRQYITFDTNVEHVSPLPNLRWLLAIRDLYTNEKSEVECDALIVANGNNFKGKIPEIPGIESFPGRVIHSHLYRHPEEYANQTVVVLGASFSGIDISIEISRFAKKIYLSHRRDKLPIDLPANVEQVSGVVGADGSELILSDNTTLKADALIFCTGYEFYYPFLDESSGIVVDGGKYVRDVYKHFLNIQRPTMAILNLPIPGLPSLMPGAQVAYFVGVLQGRIKLPSRAAMLSDAALPRGVPKSKAHHMVEEGFGYYNEVAVAAGLPPLADWYLRACFTFLPHLFAEPLHFREKKLHFNDDGTIEFY